MESGKFLIWDQAVNVGRDVRWWKSNRSGYTTEIEKAGRYTHEEAQKIERMRGTDVAVPEDIAQRASITVVDVGRLREEIEKAEVTPPKEKCPECGSPVRDKELSEGGGVACTKCVWWFCY